MADSITKQKFNTATAGTGPWQRQNRNHAGESMSDNAISRNPGILGGTPVFSGTRVPIRILSEHLEAGDSLDDFLDSYPTVSRDQAMKVLEAAKLALTGKSEN